jgi:hypothetical protein
MDNNRPFNNFYDYPYNVTTYDDRMQDKARYSAHRNSGELLTLINRLFDHHSRLLVVRIDLNYLEGVGESIPLHLIQMHLNQLIGDRRRYPDLFNGLVGYAWGLEYGAYGGGYHYHLLAFFDGSVRRDDIGIGMSIRDLWQTITGGLGRCFVSNFDKAKLQSTGDLGIGMIHREDDVLRVNLVEKVATYITKRSSEFDIDTSDPELQDFRVFGKSRMPPPINPDVPRRGRKPVPKMSY